jgi:hypothetical protein
MNSSLGLVLCVSACVPIPAPAPVQTQSPAEIQAQQRDAMARGMGYPTTKSREELEAAIHTQTSRFQRMTRGGEGVLESPAAFSIEAVRGTCYTVVLRLADGASWGAGAQAGLKFEFASPTGRGSGGPGVIGPGAIASVGCAEATGTIRMTMAPMLGQDPIGKGRFVYEVWRHVLTPAEAAHLEADKQQQIHEQQDFAARQSAEQRQHASAGCSRCDARYQGCIGAGRHESTCRDEYRTCAFEQVGPDYLSSCPPP